MARCPDFKRKGASDFMVETGISHDVIALDVGVVGALNKYAGLRDPGRASAGQQEYLPVRGAGSTQGVRGRWDDTGPARPDLVPVQQHERASIRDGGRTVSCNPKNARFERELASLPDVARAAVTKSLRDRAIEHRVEYVVWG